MKSARTEVGGRLELNVVSSLHDNPQWSSYLIPLCSRSPLPWIGLTHVEKRILQTWWCKTYLQGEVRKNIVASALFWGSLSLAEISYYIRRTLTQPYRKFHVVRNWHLLSTASTNLLLFQVICYAAVDNGNTQEASQGRVALAIRKVFLEEVIHELVLKDE